ncbi:hypothetical protein EJB05_28116 [Eragrostis curvula]|uniref:BHLH domain-containing protein n=1 Tax=Eragrostis curvula TaxID=38414 RepID=A0A5J9UPF0_9POAL|nr:hypothetical protein EJB05_28116 [Eragrostis curvula]
MEQLASRLGVGVPSASPSSSRYASCYSTPVGSPSKPVAPLFAADAAALAEGASRLSCFAGAGSGGKLSRVASSQSLLGSPAASPGGAGNLHGRDGSSSDGPSRKRKAPAGGKAKAKDAVTAAATKSPEAERRSKKSKLPADAGDEDDELKPAGGEAGNGNGKGKEVVVAEAPKDYIHVRARRGQATDNHSLAERVRREKISERMKLLQDIVPGCSKVTGKAVMLDEIINYVQSLQRQVEFLSMKLSTVNPRLEVDVDSLVQKDANQPCVPASTSLPPPPPPVYSLEGSSSAFCYASSPVVQSAVTTAKSFEAPSSFVNHGIPDHSLEGFQNANPQIGSLWEDDLQSLVQMGFRGNT